MQQVTPLLKEGVRFRRLSSRSRLYAVILVVLLFGVFLLALNVYQLRVMQHGQWPGQYSTVEGVLDKYDKKKPTIWLFGKKLGSGYLKHVISVFTRLGYVQGDDPADWDVLWAHDYPFVQLKSHLSQLKPYQKVNHFPGSGFITNKVSLATSDIKYIPKAFKIPHDKKKFFEYAKNHPEQKWVQKSNNHRGVKIKSIKELDLTSENTFIQEYVDEPFLIDDSYLYSGRLISWSGDKDLGATIV